MPNQEYTLEQMKDAEWAAKFLGNMPEQKRNLVEMIAEAFINGMKAQEQLSADNQTAQ